jgi:hypothetical protein
VFEETTTDLPRQQAPSILRAAFQDGMLGVQDADDEGYSLILKAGVLVMLNRRGRTYNRLDDAAMAQLAADAAATQKRIDGNMSQLSAEQRKMLQPVLNIQARQLAREREPPDLRRTDRRETVDGHECAVFEYFIGEEKKAEACVAAPESLPQGGEWLKAMAAIGDFTASARPKLGGAATFLFELPTHQLRMDAAVAQRLGMVVLRWREFTAERRPVKDTVLSGIHEQALDPAAFTVPADYTLQSLSPAPDERSR